VNFGKLTFNINACGQFHQYFTGSFFANNLRKKIKKQIVIREKLHKALLFEKDACKMLMKLTPCLGKIIK